MGIETVSTQRVTRFVYDDGGRGSAGYAGSVRDCVARSVAIASGAPYAYVYARLEEMSRGETGVKYQPGPDTGIGFDTADRLMGELGFTFTQHVACLWRWGRGNGGLPDGRLVLFCGDHCTAMVDGVIHDAYNPIGKGWRLVAGYWSR
jgi:hypothetical protein